MWLREQEWRQPAIVCDRDEQSAGTPKTDDGVSFSHRDEGLYHNRKKMPSALVADPSKGWVYAGGQPETIARDRAAEGEATVRIRFWESVS
jgi:hypothetical protein